MKIQILIKDGTLQEVRSDVAGEVEILYLDNLSNEEVDAIEKRTKQGATEFPFQIFKW